MSKPVVTQRPWLARRLKLGKSEREVPLWVGAILATAILLIIGAAVAPGSLSATALLSMLPYMAILGIASIGQHLVIQQRGLDLSVAGVMSLAAVLVTALPGREASAGAALAWVAVALGMGVVAGGLSGLFVTAMRVPALVTTLGVNALLIGATLILSGGTPSAAPAPLERFASSRTIEVPNTVWVLLGLTICVTFIIARTAVGRRFVAVGVSPAAAHAVAVPVEFYRVLTYMFAGLCYAIAGVLLAGFLKFPNLISGETYMLTTVAAVVVGGNSVAGGGRSSVLATVIGAIFLTYLGQLVLSVGFERSAQNIAFAIVVVCAVALTEAMRRSVRA